MQPFLKYSMHNVLISNFALKADAIAKVIKHGREDGVFQSVNEIDAAFMLTSLIHTCVFIQILEPENVVPMNDRAELVEKIFLEGLLVRE